MHQTQAIEKRAEKLEAVEEVRDGISEVVGGDGMAASGQEPPTPENATLIEQVVERISLLDKWREYHAKLINRGTAVYGTVRTVV